MAEKEAYAPRRQDHLRVDWSKIGLTQSRKQLLAECIAEYIGTTLMILVGDSVSAFTLLFSPSPYLTAYAGTAFGWGCMYTAGILYRIHSAHNISLTHIIVHCTISSCCHICYISHW